MAHFDNVKFKTKKKYVLRLSNIPVLMGKLCFSLTKTGLKQVVVFRSRSNSTVCRNRHEPDPQHQLALTPASLTLPEQGYWRQALWLTEVLKAGGLLVRFSDHDGKLKQKQHKINLVEWPSIIVTIFNLISTVWWVLKLIRNVFKISKDA